VRGREYHSFKERKISSFTSSEYGQQDELVCFGFCFSHALMFSFFLSFCVFLVVVFIKTKSRNHQELLHHNSVHISDHVVHVFLN